MREIILDTETTGMDPEKGDRIVEIGCIELSNGIVTDDHYHCYINPERDMPEGAFKVHGLSEKFLSKHPVFSEVAQDFLEFIGDSRLVIHNAEFDMKFINWELIQCGLDPIPMSGVCDTLAIARRKFPGQRASLDALCQRYNIDRSRRTKHGALLDSELLAQVYIELMGGRQKGLALNNDGSAKIVDGLSARNRSNDVSGAKLQNKSQAQQSLYRDQSHRKQRQFSPTPEEIAEHQAFVDNIKGALWKKVSSK